jgi:hypothetical protein
MQQQWNIPANFGCISLDVRCLVARVMNAGGNLLKGLPVPPQAAGFEEES